MEIKMTHEETVKSLISWLCTEMKPQRVPGRVRIVLEDKITELLEQRFPTDAEIDRSAHVYSLVQKGTVSEKNSFRSGFAQCAQWIRIWSKQEEK